MVNLLIGTRCAWLYALLANLPEPLHRDTCAEVRRVAKAAAWIHAREVAREVAPDGAGPSQEQRALAAVLVIAGVYFNQAPHR